MSDLVILCNKTPRVLRYFPNYANKCEMNVDEILFLNLQTDWYLRNIWCTICDLILQNAPGNFCYDYYMIFDIDIEQFIPMKNSQITKFGRSKDIPRHFITKKIPQNGIIKAIEPNQTAGAILRIDHKPPLNLIFWSQKTLPVKV